MEIFRLLVSGLIQRSPSVRIVPTYRPKSWITRASPGATIFTPVMQKNETMTSSTPKMQTGMPRPLLPFEPTTPPMIASPMPAITPTTVSSRPRPPGMLCAVTSLTCGSGICGASGVRSAARVVAARGLSWSDMGSPVSKD